jgi:hypothetical protein
VVLLLLVVLALALALVLALVLVLVLVLALALVLEPVLALVAQWAMASSCVPRHPSPALPATTRCAHRSWPSCCINLQPSTRVRFAVTCRPVTRPDVLLFL